MSNPPNLLASYRSYSYYHVLVMCDSTATADLLATSTSDEIWMHATPDTSVIDSSRPGVENLGRFNPKQIVGEDGMKGRYIVLINGSTDAQYVIEKATWVSATAADAVPGDMSTSLALEGSIVISEPKGVAFLDQVVKCCGALGIQSSSVVYVLKTFFVGHGFDPEVTNNEVYEQISDIPPLNFICWEVTGGFSTQGGTYEMQFVAAGHGAARLPQYGKIPQSMTIAAGSSLQETIQRFQDAINVKYQEYYKCVVDQIAAVKGVNPQPLIDSLRSVQYVVEVGTDYQDNGGQVKYTVTDQPAQYKNAPACTSAANISIQPDTSIESALRQIMAMSNEVQQDAAVGDGSGAKYEYKIHSFVESMPQSLDSSKIQYTVRYRIERTLVPKSVANTSMFAVLQKSKSEISMLQFAEDPLAEAIRRNVIEFDYMYTGKNVDILEFDMKVNMGLQYLQTATLANSFKGQLEPVANREMSVSTADVNAAKQFSNSPIQIPVLFGSQLKLPGAINAQSAGTTIQAAYTMAKHSSIEVLEAKMKIVGNTELLRSSNATSSPEGEARKSANPLLNQAPAGQPAGSYAKFQDWTRIPAFAKVNIKMPRNNDDFSLFTGTADAGSDPSQVGVGDYAQDFWFDGYYYVCGIEHVFEGGEFTQNLDMIGLPRNDAFETSKSGSMQAKEVNIEPGQSSCFSSTVSTATTTPAAPLDAAPATPPSTTAPEPAPSVQPTTRPDAVSILNSKYQLGDVVGWNKAAPDVQRAIIQAAERVGVDPIILAMFGAKESSFRARATAAPASSATGLFQFLKSTWNGMVNQGKAAGQVTTSGASPAPNDPRFDPFNNATAGANFLKDNARAIGSSDAGDLYLAHFLGPGTAAKVIKADKASSGSQPLSACLGSAAAAKIARANPTIVNSQTTVGNLRNWASVSMAKMLSGGTSKKDSPNKQNQSVTTQAVPTSIPRTSEQADVRKADTAIAAQQDAAAQAAKTKTSPPCGPRATQAQVRAIDNATAASASSAPTTGAMPGQANPVNIA